MERGRAIDVQGEKKKKLTADAKQKGAWLACCRGGKRPDGFGRKRAISVSREGFGSPRKWKRTWERSVQKIRFEEKEEKAG